MLLRSLYMIGLVAGLGACAAGNPNSDHLVLAEEGPHSLQECIELARERTRPTGHEALPVAIVTVALSIRRGLGESSCLDQFGRYRADQWDNTVAVQKVDQHLDVPVYNDRFGYEKSTVYGAAQSATSAYDYGEFGCRMTGGFYSIC